MPSALHGLSISFSASMSWLPGSSQAGQESSWKCSISSVAVASAHGNMAIWHYENSIIPILDYS